MPTAAIHTVTYWIIKVYNLNSIGFCEQKVREPMLIHIETCEMYLGDVKCPIDVFRVEAYRYYWVV